MSTLAGIEKMLADNCGFVRLVKSFIALADNYSTTPILLIQLVELKT